MSVFDQKGGRFEFHEGPVFANVVLADEINRASPKTQSALLEVMSERRVTVDGVPRPVPRPFLVIATQNPIELEGTYRLPEAELDRFLIRTSIGHPDVRAEVEVLRAHGSGQPVVDSVAPAAGGRAGGVAHPLRRDHPRVRRHPGLHRRHRRRHPAPARAAPGGQPPRFAGPAAGVARCWPPSEGRTFVTPEDVKFLAEPVLGHRVILTPEAELQGLTGGDLVRRAVDRVPLPNHR